MERDHQAREPVGLRHRRPGISRLERALAQHHFLRQPGGVERQPVGILECVGSNQAGDVA